MKHIWKDLVNLTKVYVSAVMYSKPHDSKLCLLKKKIQPDGPYSAYVQVVSNS